MRLIRFTFALLLAALAVPHAFAASGTSVRAILITATNHKREADPKLREFEAALQRNLPLSSFRYVAEGTASVGGSGPATLSLGRGHQLQLNGSRSGDGVELKVRWTSGGEVVMNTSLTLHPGVPAVLGRRPSDNSETPIILVIAK